MKRIDIHIRLVTALLTLATLSSQSHAQTLTQKLKAEVVAELAAEAREKGSAVRGAILFSQQKLGCVNCHAAGNDSLLGPDLTRRGTDLTDVQLVESLLDPSKLIRKGFETVIVVTNAGKSLTGRILEQSSDRLVLRDHSPERRLVTLRKMDIDQIVNSDVSSMPEKLADQLQNRQEFLDLVRYAMEIAATGSRPVVRSFGGGSVSAELQGLVLIKDFNCAACHPDDLAQTQVSVKQAPDLIWSDGRLDPDYIRRFITDPAKVKPGTTMPAVISSYPKEEQARMALELTHYLASLTERSFARPAVDAAAADRGRDVFHTVGCVACHSPRNSEDEELLAATSVPLGQPGQKYNVDSLTAFLKEPHLVRPAGRMPDMKLTHWEAVDLAHYLCRGSEEDSADSQQFAINQALVVRGHAAFGLLGCAQCHRTNQAPLQLNLQPLSKVRTDHGCLSQAVGAGPRFSLTDTQRDAIRLALARGQKPLTDAEKINAALTAFRCLNCHQRGDLGGVTPERNPHFQTTDPNLGPQGRIPPTLTSVGAKLKPAWMRQVLVSGRTIRPYVLSRMPQYGTQNMQHLVELLQQVDELPDVEFPEFPDQKQMREAGFEMAGTSGLNCIACHTFQMKRAATMPAVDLTDMAERLQKPWFYHYMRNPQRLSLNTVMPSFWPGGRSIRKDILNGDSDLQLEALWQYLLDGRQARQPRGLIIEPMELLATDEAVMLRRSYPNVGKRGIGVGYPQQVNLVFDAEQMRLAMLWQGKFADPGGVWRSQGHGTVRPLSRHVIQLVKGPDFDDATAPWVVDDDRPPRHHFRGYALDDKQRPQFMYEFDGVMVRDKFVDVVDEPSGKPFLRRTLQLTSNSLRPDCALRVVSGQDISARDDGTFSIDGKLAIRTSQPGEIQQTSAGRVLRLPIDVPAGTVSLVVEYHWLDSSE